MKRNRTRHLLLSLLVVVYGPLLLSGDDSDGGAIIELKDRILNSSVRRLANSEEHGQGYLEEKAFGLSLSLNALETAEGEDLEKMVRKCVQDTLLILYGEVAKEGIENYVQSKEIFRLNQLMNGIEVILDVNWRHAPTWEELRP